MSSIRAASRDLADRLVVEYSGALPPGQVLAIVFRTARQRAGVPSLTAESRLVMCEIAARRALTDRIAGTSDLSRHVTSVA
jgi:hypothetical protein